MISQMAAHECRRVLWGAFVALVAWSAPGKATASSTYCWGTMMFEDCRPAGDHVWPANSQPTFGAACESCGGPPTFDCRIGPADVFVMAMQVAGQRISGPEQFQRLPTTCGDHGLFRYTGPLVAGMRHDIHLGTWPSGIPRRDPSPSFVVGPTVNAEPPGEAGVPEPATAAEPVEAGAGPDLAVANETHAPREAPVDGATGDARPARSGGGGCGCAVSDATPSAAGALGALLLAVFIAARVRPWNRFVRRLAAGGLALAAMTCARGPKRALEQPDDAGVTAGGRQASRR